METYKAPSWLSREAALIGDEAVEKLTRASVLLFGAGGVGGYVAEGLVRAGIGRLAVVDHDRIADSNLNRQITTDSFNIGCLKANELCLRARRINPLIEVLPFCVFAGADNIGDMIETIAPDFICDAVDTVTAKLLIIENAKLRSISVISSMGTGNKLDPTRFRITDITETEVCPLARVMRRELKNRNISKVEVLWSDEPPRGSGGRTPASISYVPAAAGLIIAGHIIDRIINNRKGME